MQESITFYQVAGALLIIFGVLVARFGNQFGAKRKDSSSVQEGNPTPLVFGIIKLHVQNKDIVQISDKPHKRYLMRFTNDGYKPLYEMLSEQSWTKYDQLGSALIFKKDKEELLVSSRMYTGKYMVIWY